MNGSGTCGSGFGRTGAGAGAGWAGVGDGGAAATAGFGGTGAAGAGAAPGATPGEARFTQEDLNRYLAEDKRKHQAQLQRVEKTLEEVSASKNLTIQEREQVAAQRDELQQERQTAELSARRYAATIRLIKALGGGWKEE